MEKRNDKTSQKKSRAFQISLPLSKKKDLEIFEEFEKSREMLRHSRTAALVVAMELYNENVERWMEGRTAKRRIVKSIEE